MRFLHRYLMSLTLDCKNLRAIIHIIKKVNIYEIISCVSIKLLSKDKHYFLSVCSIDRMIALLKPLRYRCLMNLNVIRKLATGCWVTAVFGISVILVTFVIEEGTYKVYRNNANLALCDPQVQHVNLTSHKNICQKI